MRTVGHANGYGTEEMRILGRQGMQKTKTSSKVSGQRKDDRMRSHRQDMDSKEKSRRWSLVVGREKISPTS